MRKVILLVVSLVFFVTLTSFKAKKILYPKTYVIYTMNGVQHLIELDGIYDCSNFTVGSVDSIDDCWNEWD